MSLKLSTGGRELDGGRQLLAVQISEQELCFHVSSLLLKHVIPFIFVGYYKPER